MKYFSALQLWKLPLSQGSCLPCKQRQCNKYGLQLYYFKYYFAKDINNYINSTTYNYFILLPVKILVLILKKKILLVLPTWKHG